MILSLDIAGGKAMPPEQTKSFQAFRSQEVEKFSHRRKL